MTKEEILKSADRRMDATVSDTQGKLVSVRTGRASLSILDGVRVDYYGTPTPLNQVGRMSVPEPAMLAIQPFDASMLEAIERAIHSSDLGLNPANDGKLIRIPIPPLTEERRKQMVKKVRGMGEEGKQAVRQIRRDANEELKALQKTGELSEDDAKRGLDEVQKRTDAHTKAIDDLCENKESELMEV